MRACSCWSRAMEEQEDLRWGARRSHGHLATLRDHGVPPPHLGVPLPHSLPGRPLPLVQCLHFHPQVSFCSTLTLMRFRPAAGICGALLSSFSLSCMCHNLLYWFFRSPPNIPEVKIPEDLTVNIALSLRYEINRGFATLREIGHGRDLKKFLIVC